ncbi:transcriptional regulator [Massilia sp. MB5]|uniref:hypothetical protein n=1 Tax=unclassified Massilia TaxID=2609279 RepID=UPI00067D9298|nr:MULTISPECIES: hypothetical protein [unclassified Massilia]AKU21854.1 transcriptional regulator [Massilia sp. NR 4-1]UMR28523.1 transcriptional regulator [Massilia sp. MB5]
MKISYIIAAALGASAITALASNALPLPAQWLLAGESPRQYIAGVDMDTTVSGKGAKFLRHAKGNGQSWATVMQQIAPDHYLGKRVRFKAKVKTKDVSEWAGLWMRIDTPRRSKSPFYNSEDKPINGTTAWQLRSVVLDVPQDATSISFGVIGGGKGQVWIDALALEIVGNEVPVDVQPNSDPLPTTPQL